MPKSTQIRPFWFRIETFSFFHKVLQLGRFEGDDFIYNNIIFKFQSQNTQISHFWSQIWWFLLLHQILQQYKFKDTDFNYKNFFWILAQKYSNKTLLTKPRSLFFCKILLLDKFEGADFKYKNSFFQILIQKYQHEAFLVRNLGVFVISWNFPIRQIRGYWFKIWQFFFVKSLPKNT